MTDVGGRWVTRQEPHVLLSREQARHGRAALLRSVALGTYAGVFIVCGLRIGWPLGDRPVLLLWLIGGGFLATVGQRGGGFAVLRDWLPYGVAMTAYDYSRGAADGLGMPHQEMLPIVVDKFLFFGHVPSVELQRWLGPYGRSVRWWEIPVAITYATHFVVPFVIPMVLWVRDRERFGQWRRRFFTIVAAGLATYVLLPGVPPWLAARHGTLPALDRTVSRGWSRLGIHFAARVWNQGAATFNLVAALPSLHAAFAGLATVFFWRRAPRWVKPLLAAYPLMMMFSLVAGAEHYVADILLGWLDVVLCCAAWDRIERRRAGSQAPAAEVTPALLASRSS